MSSLYKEALADSNLLKEMAKQAAQQEIIEKYSSEFKNSLLQKLFENEDKSKEDDILLDEEEDPSNSSNQNDLNIEDFEQSAQQDSLSPQMQNGIQGGKPDEITGDFNTSDPTETVKKLPFAALDNKGLKESADSDEEIEIDLDGITPESENSLGNINQKSENNIDISTSKEVKDDIKELEPEQNVEEPNIFDERPDDKLNESITMSKDQFMLYLEKDLEQEERINLLESKITEIVEVNKKQQHMLTIYEKQLKNSNKKLEESIKLEYKFNILSDSSLSGRQKKNLIEAIDKFNGDVKSIGTLVESIKSNNNKEVKNTTLLEFNQKSNSTNFFVTKPQPIVESKESPDWVKVRELAGIKNKQ